jgi:LemA protein
MKKWLPIIVIVLLVIIGYNWGKGINNTAVVNQESAKTAWSNVESAYQRRSNLIGNLVNTVKGAAEFEKSTLTDVINARAKATSTTIDASNLNAANIAQFQQAQTGLTGALSRLLVSIERYPDLKANQNFLSLQSQLEGTENRIKMEIDRFNKDVKNYNIHIRKFPNSILAGWFGFEEMKLFEAKEGSDEVPVVDFNSDKKE